MVQEYEVTLLEKNEVARDTMEFVLEKPEGFAYRAGQYGDLVLPPSSGLDESNNKHGFSFASAPFEKTLKMTTRMRGSAFKNAARLFPAGEKVGLLALWGDFTLQKNEKKPALFIIGGIGITPVRSILLQAEHEHTAHDLTLIYANRRREDAAYTKEFEALAKRNPHFKFIPVYTEEEGRVDLDRIKAAAPNFQEARSYLAGPEGMVKAMRELLIKGGADEDEIRTEEFEGY